MQNETYTLPNGIRIPKLGLGTWFIDSDKVSEAVTQAVKIGYRLIDTAQAYKNEAGVGAGVRNCEIKPVVNQILVHIGNTPGELMRFCEDQNILVEAYSPIAHGEVLKNKAITDMANQYGVSPARLCIRYAIELGAVALPKTANPEHMKDNADLNFHISDKDMEMLKSQVFAKDYGEFSRFPVFSGKEIKQ